MPRIKANGIEFEYDETGPKDGIPVVLVMGFTAQMTKWPDAFRHGIAKEGYRVIRFDNRDIGLSYKFADKGMPDMASLIGAVTTGGDPKPHAPYLLDDMAADLAAVIDALDARPAHVLGASMGGMIVQLAALNHPDHVRSMIPVMTTSGDPALPPSKPEAMEALTAQPKSMARDDVVEHGVWVQTTIGSADSLRDSNDILAAAVGASYDRSYEPLGAARQYAAILAQPRWHEQLGSIKAPTMVLHGEVDPLIPPEGGKDVADRIPGATYVEVERWGHDVPSSVVPTLVEHVTGFLKRVDGG